MGGRGGRLRTAVLACDLCALYPAQEAQAGGKGFYGGVAEQFTYFDTYQSDGHTASNPDSESLASLTSQIFAGCNFNQRVGVQFNLPVIYRDYRKNGAHGSEAGIGDVSLIGNLRAYKYASEDFTFSWTALGGIKFPTGGTGQLNPANPDFAAGIGGHDLTLGSGSYDGLVGARFSTCWKKWFLNGEMQYRIRTAGAYYYQFANDWSWSGGPGGYLALEDNDTVAFQFAVSGESKGQDTENGVPTDDTALTIVYLGPQFSFTWSDKLSMHIGVDLPVSIASTGDPLVPDYRIHAVVTWRF